MTRLYDITDFCKHGSEIENYPYIGTVDVRVNIHEAIKIGKDYYIPGIISANSTKAGVRKATLTLGKGASMDCENEFTCPCCGAIDYNSFELDDDGDTRCGSCDALLSFERVATVEYNTTLIEPPDIVNAKWVKDEDELIEYLLCQLGEMKGKIERGELVSVVRCGDCLYYHKAHILCNGGTEKDISEFPKEALDFTNGFVTSKYGINVGGKCELEKNCGYAEDKSVFRGPNDYCSRGERSVDNAND